MTHETRVLNIIKRIAARDGLTTREEVRAAWQLMTDLDEAASRKAFYRGLMALRLRGLIQEDKLGVIVLIKPPRGITRVPIIVGLDAAGDEVIIYVPEEHVELVLGWMGRGKISDER